MFAFSERYLNRLKRVFTDVCGFFFNSFLFLVVCLNVALDQEGFPHVNKAVKMETIVCCIGFFLIRSVLKIDVYFEK